ncbi:MAG TPA: ABC transporter permease, partial [Alphaproteobacteria bacterium]|nr:ABC transporter permease [Alphaproteobacteria bacterium]
MPLAQLVRLSLRLLRREARSGELTLIFFSLLLAMTLSTAISVFSARLDQAILDNAGDYLGAPLRVRSTEAFDEQWLKDAEEQGLRTARVVTFPSVVLNPPDVGDEMTLASVKAVDDGYPINSRLRVRFSDTGTAELQSHGPEPGNVWAEPRLLLLLGRNLGDQVEVGQGLKTITGIIEEESDRTGSFYNLSPRIMLHWQDVEGTPLLGPGSRTSYTLMLDGPDDALERYIEGRELTANQRVETLEDGNQALSGSVSRAREYLSLAALLAVILATVAITVSSGRFARRHLDTGALLRTFGLQKRQMAAIFMLQWLVLFLLAWLSSALIALGLQQVIISLLASVVPEGLPSAPLLAWLTGPVTGLVCLVGFGLPQLRPLFNVTPLRVLRRDIESGGMAFSSIMVLAVLTLFGVVTVFTGDWVLSASLVLGGGLISALL